MNQQIQELNTTVFCKLGVSLIHGIGVIAIRDIPKDTLFAVHINSVYRIYQDDFHLILPEIQELILDRTLFGVEHINLVFESPNTSAALQSFMNHSETPNSNGYKAIKDIKKGEEVTENYKSFYTATFPHKLSSRHMAKVWGKGVQLT